MSVATVNNNPQPVSTESTGAGYDPADVRQRPVFYKELGEFFAALRPSDWTQSDAARYAKRRGLKALSRNVLLRLEKGQVKNPEPDVLKALATLYDMPYETLAGRFIEQRYGIRLGGDLPRHSRDQKSGSLEGGSADVPASDSARRLQSISQRDRTLAGEVRDAIRALTSVAITLEEEAGSAGGTTSRRSRRPRKTG